MFDVRRLFAAQRASGPATPLARGVAALNAGRPDLALPCFVDAVAAAADDAARALAHNKCGVALVALARRDEAVAAFCDALACDERHAAALVNLGNLLLDDGHAADAVDHYEAAIRADDALPSAYQGLGVALRRLGRRAESVRALKTAARLEARRPPGRA